MIKSERKKSLNNRLLNDLFSLLYPEYCLICECRLTGRESAICLLCRYQLPKTGIYDGHDPALSKLFWGRIPVEYCYSYYRFEKGNKVQSLIYNLKYKSAREIGALAGEWMGAELSLFRKDDFPTIIVPMPLHINRQRKRGYNQSEFFARGLASALNIDVANNCFERISDSSTQTRKNRYERWKNVSEIFRVKEAAAIKDRHVLLVDDVITTGSTLEAAGMALLSVQGVKLSIATIAVAST